MTDPLLTIVIPTKGRAEKLRHTLRTVTEQPDDRFEVVISDNLSTDGTQSLVTSLGDPRIRYFRTDRRLSMCDNYDFALQQVKSKYVLFIGDDDGLMPGSVSRLISLIETKSYSIYYWPLHVYIWGWGSQPPAIDYVATPQKPKEIALRPLVERTFKIGGARYQALPLVYHSLVATDLLTSIRKRTGRVFHSTAPDVFCGFALPVFSDIAFNVGEAMTLAGGSEVGCYNPSQPGERYAEHAARHEQFIKEYGQYNLHRTLDPTLFHIVNVVPDSMLVAADLFPEYYKGVKLNYEFMYAQIQHYWRFTTVAQIVKRRRSLKARHPFNTWLFLIYAFMFRTFSIFQTLRDGRRRAARDANYLYSQHPPDVYSCANLIAQSLTNASRATTP